MRMTIALFLAPCIFAADESAMEKPAGLNAGIASDKGGEFLALVQQYEEDGRAYPGGPRLSPGEYAKRCLEIARRNTHVRMHALMESIRMAPDTAESGEAVDWFVRDFVTEKSHSNIDQLLIFSPNGWALSARTTERLLRAILERNPAPKIRGLACYCLAACLKSRTEQNAQLPSREVDALLDESAQFFRRATQEYGDIRSQGKTIGELSQVELDDLRALRPGRPAPDLRGKGLNDEPLSLTNLRGKVVLLSFWATWCGPCMDAVPHERELVHRFKGRPFVLQGVNGDDDMGKAKSVVEKEEITWPSYRNEGSRGPITDQWHVRVWPTVYLIDHHGTIRRRFTLFPDAKTFDPLIEALIAECERETMRVRAP